MMALGGSVPTQRSLFGGGRPSPGSPGNNPPSPNNSNDERDEDDGGNAENAIEPPAAAINIPSDRQTASNRRQDVLRIFLIITLVLFIFGGDSPPPPDKKHTNDSEDSKHRIVLNPPSLGAMQAVFDSTAPAAPWQPLNVTGLYRGQWRGEVANPFASHLNTIKHNDSAAFEEGGLLLQLESVPVVGLPQLCFVFGVLRTYASPSNPARAPSIVFSLPMQGVVLARERQLLMFPTPYKSHRLLVSLVPSNASGSSSLWGDQGELRYPAGPSQASFRVALVDMAARNASSLGLGSAAFLLGENSLSARFRYLQSPAPAASLAPYRNHSSALSCAPRLSLLLPPRQKEGASEEEGPNTQAAAGDSGGAATSSVEKIHAMQGSLAAAAAACSSSSSSSSSPSSPSSFPALSLSLESLDLHLSALSFKVQVYALGLFLVTLLQILLVVWQLRHA
eukprot:gene40571-49463_t